MVDPDRIRPGRCRSHIIRSGRCTDGLIAEKRQDGTFHNPERSPSTIDVDNDVFVENLKKATVLSKLLCYAQGLSLLKKASEVYDYNFNYYRILRIWRGY